MLLAESTSVSANSEIFSLVYDNGKPKKHAAVNRRQRKSRKGKFVRKRIPEVVEEVDTEHNACSSTNNNETEFDFPVEQCSSTAQEDNVVEDNDGVEVNSSSSVPVQFSSVNVKNSTILQARKENSRIKKYRQLVNKSKIKLSHGAFTGFPVSLKTLEFSHCPGKPWNLMKNCFETWKTLEFYC